MNVPPRFQDDLCFLNGNRFSFRRIAHFVKNSLTYDMLTFQDHSRSFGLFKFFLRLENFPY